MMDTVAPVLHFLARENSPEDVLLDICLQKRGGGRSSQTALVHETI